MKIDSYTKFLLTVITACLMYLCAKDLIAIPRVQAESPARVMLVDENNTAIAGTNSWRKPLDVACR